MILAASCTTKTGTAVVDLQSQQAGLTSVHNARQLGGYVIGDKQIKKDLLLRTARLSALSAEDSLLLTEKYKVQRVYDFRSAGEIQTAPDIIPGDARHLPLSISFFTYIKVRNRVHEQFESAAKNNTSGWGAYGNYLRWAADFE